MVSETLSEGPATDDVGGASKDQVCVVLFLSVIMCI